MIRSIDLGERIIEYELCRKQVKHINVTVKVDGRIYVSANHSVEVSEIEDFLLHKAKAILKGLEQFENIKEMELKTYLLGKEVPVILKLVEPKKEMMFYDGKQIHIGVRSLNDMKLVKICIKKIVDHLAEDILRKQFDKAFEKCKASLSEKPFLVITVARSWWGKCWVEDNEIELNKLLVMMPEECIEFVVLHEFCHLVSGDHGERFYEKLTSCLPDWKEREKLLNEFQNTINAGVMPDYRELNCKKEELFRIPISEYVESQNCLY